MISLISAPSETAATNISSAGSQTRVLLWARNKSRNASLALVGLAIWIFLDQNRESPLPLHSA
jgi:hypothetical protein